MLSLGEYEGIVVRWSLVVQSVSSIIYSVRRVCRESVRVEFLTTSKNYSSTPHLHQREMIIEAYSTDNVCVEN